MMKIGTSGTKNVMQTSPDNEIDFEVFGEQTGRIEHNIEDFNQFEQTGP